MGCISSSVHAGCTVVERMDINIRKDGTRLSYTDRLSQTIEPNNNNHEDPTAIIRSQYSSIQTILLHGGVATRSTGGLVRYHLVGHLLLFSTRSQLQSEIHPTSIQEKCINEEQQ